jgi:hypothetical protein
VPKVGPFLFVPPTYLRYIMMLERAPK